MQNYLDFKEKIDYTKLNEVARTIKQGGIVVFPTETVYGIGTNGLKENSVKRLYEVKQRPLNKPISLLVNSMDMINDIAQEITDLEKALINEFIFEQKKDTVPNIVTANSNTVGVRMPSNKIALKLIEYAGVPIATPSANISGKPSGTNMEDIMKDFKGKVDCYIDDGPSKIGISSTIVQVIDGVPHILRQGKITEEQINKVKEKVKKCQDL